jgi:hypothetical protein
MKGNESFISLALSVTWMSISAALAAIFTNSLPACDPCYIGGVVVKFAVLTVGPNSALRVGGGGNCGR